MDKLPRHIERHREVFQRCAEIIHCDSHSVDGTAEFLNTALAHPNLTQIDHPPGLYQSWNHAIQQCTQEYIYISTIGDYIDLAGLRKILTLADQTTSDVVITPPLFVEENGQPQGMLKWPIHNVISAYNISTPRAVPAYVLFAEAVMHAPDGITGSAASCLFRTSFLKSRPFPLGYYGACDTAWAIRYILDARCAIHPEPVATFLLHPKSYESNEAINTRMGIVIQRLSILELRRRCSEQARKSDPVMTGILRELRAWRISTYLEMAQYYRLKRRRKKLKAFWLFDSKTWKARYNRNIYRQRALSLGKGIRARLHTLLDKPASPE